VEIGVRERGIGSDRLLEVGSGVVGPTHVERVEAEHEVAAGVVGGCGDGDPHGDVARLYGGSRLLALLARAGRQGEERHSE
jgi:hypothetical protein